MTSRKWMVAPVLALLACGSAPDNGTAAEKLTSSDAPSSPALATPAAGTGSACKMVTAPDAEPSPTREAGDTTRPASLRADVVAFRQRRDECDHFRGEEPYDAERAAFLHAALARTCKGTDAELAGLRKRYARDRAALRALVDYDPNVDPLEDDL